MRLALIVALAMGCHGSPAPSRTPLRTAIALPGDIVERVVLSGALQPTEAIELVAPTTDFSGLTIRKIATDGSAVHAGDHVLELDDAPIVSKLVDGRNALASAKLALKVLRRSDAALLADEQYQVRAAEIARTKAQLQIATAALGSRRQAENNRFELAKSERKLAAAEHDLAAARQELAIEEHVKEIEIEKTRVANASNEQALLAIVVAAVRDGIVVIQRLAQDGHKLKVGDPVTDGQVLLTQPDLTKPMDVGASLSDVDDGQIAVDQSGTCTLDAYPDAPIACTVTKLAPRAHQREGHDSLRRAFDVTLTLAKSATSDAARMQPGMSVKVVIERRRANGLVVPRTAIDRSGIARVRLAAGQQRTVAISACDAQRCVVAAGLVPGDVVTL